REAVVLLDQARDGGSALIAYLVRRGEMEAPAAAELRAHLKRRLPDYMTPSAFVTLAELPLTANGKLDRRALAAAEPASSAASVYHAPRSAVEKEVAGVLSEALGSGGVGVGGNVFELGGHSLLATQVVSRLRKVFGVELPLRRMFESPTVEGLARAIEAEMRLGARARPPIRRVPREGELPLSFAQQRLWFLDQLEPN